eukprot:c6660_g1_i1.p1 GENE.c6660_g1_i1~~c6660_g1_i1.p1  ORF type:complete len:321 (+),score=57.05 c6660_g1_i1:43-1005(+)
MTTPCLFACGELKVEIFGGGIAGWSSSLLVNVFRSENSKCTILFDAGGVTIPIQAVKKHNKLPILISHLHADHFSGIHAILAARSLSGLQTKIVLPHHADQTTFQQMLQLQMKLNNPFATRPDLDFEIVSAHPMQELTRLLTAQRKVVPFATQHTLASCGYAIVFSKTKLKAEYVGKDIAKLRAELGDALFDKEEVVEVAYTGDTTIAFLNPSLAKCTPHVQVEQDDLQRTADLVRKAKVLITECTYFGTDTPRELAHERGHIHGDDIIDNIDLFDEVEHLVLTHFSQKYGKYQAQAFIDGLPEKLRQKTQLLFPVSDEE